MLTEHQKLALDHKSNLSVTANAGAGKTTVLVHRFVDILLQTDAQINELVAITFTEKAAGELRKKIADHVEGMIVKATNVQEELKYEYIRDRLVAANIGTIHSFCAQLLREYPVEADVDASFTILEGFDQQVLEHESMREAFDAALADNDGVEQLLDLVRMLGHSLIENYLKTFMQKRDQIDRMSAQRSSLENGSEQGVLENWNKIIFDNIESRLDESSWLSSFEKILKTAGGKTSDAVKELFDSRYSQKNQSDKISLYREIFEKIFTKEFTLRQNFIGQKTDWKHIRDEVKNVSDHYRSISTLMESAGNPESGEGNETLLHILRILLTIHRDALRRYDEQKREYGKLDFEDILLKTKFLLRQDSLNSSIAKRFRYIMVDEFQDTNQLQYEILQRLTSNLQTGNLFVVGDPKQSIYGFRDAEVEVFEKMKSEIMKTSKGKGLVLAESFRLLPNLIDFVNRVFSQTMSESSLRYDVVYDELVQGRKNNAEGKVELLLHSSDNNRPDENSDYSSRPFNNGIEIECRMIADHILRMAEKGENIFSKKDEFAIRFQYRDAAILLRKRTHLPVLEKIFTEFHIPYILSGGIGFYQTQEVIDFLNYLQFLLAPDDDIACAGIYRSPFFSISDAELYEISLVSANSLWGKSCKFAEGQNVTNGLKRAIRILSAHLDLANRISIPSLVQEILLRTGWLGTVAGLKGGERNLANIQKLLRAARAFEMQGYNSLYDFVQRLKTLVEHEEREGQASIDFKGNCVQIMTIHAAKGLEFPVVYLPFAHKEFRYDDEPYIDFEYGVGFGVKSKTDFDKKISPSFYELLKYRSRLKTEAEEKRIFYVACTRARDVLVLSGQLKDEFEKKSCLKWVFESLKIEPTSIISGKYSFSSAPLKILDTSNTDSSVRLTKHNLSINYHISDGNGLKGRKADQKEQINLSVKELFLTKLKGRIQGELFSATQIKTFLECPAKYYLKYLLGVPETNAVSRDFDEISERDDAIDGQAEGLLTHAVLQTMDKSTITNEELNKKIRIVLGGSSLPAGDSPGLVERIFNNIGGFAASKSGKEILDAPEYYTEYPINISFGGNYLTGTIDRLYRGKDRKWNIADYKTDRVKEDELEKCAETYRPQLQFYSLLVNRLYNQDSVQTSIIFLKYPSRPFQMNFILSDMNQFEQILHEVIRKIQNRQFERKLSFCPSCPYQEKNFCV